MKDTILYGDCRESLKNITTKCQMCVTSPPYYGLRDYGGEASQIGQESTPEEYIQEMVKTFRLVRDNLTDDGTLWLNIGDSYYNYRPGKGSRTYPQQTIASNNQDLPEYTNKRGNKLEGYKEKDLIGIPWMLAFALRADGWYLRQDIIWHKPNPMPESVKDRCTKSHEYLFLLSKNKNYYYDHESIKEKAVGERWGGNNPINMDNTKDTNNTFSGLTRPRKMVYDKRNKRSVWKITNRPYKGAHFATFPPDLVKPCILAGSRKDDVILDPFMGSGTTALVAKELGRYYLCLLYTSDAADE